MTGTKTSTGALGVLFLVVMIDMIGFGIIIPFLTYFIEDLATAEGLLEFGLWVGLMMSAYSAAQFLFSPFWGSLSDRMGRKPIIIAGLVGNSVFFTIFGMSTSLIMALIARFMAGAFNANIAVAKAYIGDVSDHLNLAKRMGLIGAAFGVGFTIGPFIGGEFSNPASKWNLFTDTIFATYPYLLPCVIASVLSIISLFLAIKWLPESKFTDNDASKTSLNPVKQLSSIVFDLKRVMAMPQLGNLLMVSVLFMYGFTIMHASFVLFTEWGLGFDEAENGRVFLLIGLNGLLIQGVLIGKLTNKFGSMKLMRWGTLICGIGLTLIPHVSTEFVWLTMSIVVLMISTGNSLFQPSYMAILAQETKHQGYEMGLVMGTQESASAFARIFGPLTGGIVWDLSVNKTGLVSDATTFHLCGLMLLAAFLLQFRIKASNEMISENFQE
ncbi:MAG: MFS transporter [Candidatus Poseidoniaceae archaeon]|jgi:MFS family permease|nr:MFS transporter [Candidatus Poseidoniaceae archaeon]